MRPPQGPQWTRLRTTTATSKAPLREESSDGDEDGIAPGSQAQASQEPSQRSQPRARARARAPLRVFDLEDGEPHAFPIHTIIESSSRRPRWLPARVQRGRVPRARNPAG